MLDKPVELIGVGPVDQIIAEAVGNSCLSMRATYAVVRGLTFRGGLQSEKARRHVVDIPRSRLVLEDCRIISGARSCVAVHGTAASPVLRCCTIRHYGCLTIRHCRIRDSISYGIHAEDYAEGSVEDSEILNNGHVGVRIESGSIPALRRCRITDNSHAVSVASTGGGLVL